DFHVTGVQTCALPILAFEYVIASHHCQLLWYSVGNASNAGCSGSHRMPSVCGGCPRVHAVFQKMLENPTAISPPFSFRSVDFGSDKSTEPPSANSACAFSSSLSVM